MTLDTTTLLAIIAMAIVTYVTRIAGLFVADRLVLTGRAKAAFDAIPPAVLVAVGLTVAMTGVASDLIALTAVGFLVDGVGIATWDVSMNVEAAEVERRLGRTVMPRFTRPLVGSSSPVISRSSVDLPAPFSPSSPTRWPGPRFQSISWSTSRSP